MRQGKTDLLAVSVPKGFIEKLEELRWKHKMTRSRYVLQALEKYIDEHEQTLKNDSAQSPATEEQ